MLLGLEAVAAAYLDAGPWLWCWVPLASTDECSLHVYTAQIIIAGRSHSCNQVPSRDMDDAVKHRHRHTHTHRYRHTCTQTLTCVCRHSLTRIPWSDKTINQTHRKTQGLTTTVMCLTLREVTHATRSCQSVDGARHCLVDTAQGRATGNGGVQ